MSRPRTNKENLRKKAGKVSEEVLKELNKALPDDSVNHPSHYTHGGIECIDAMESAFGTEAVMWFCVCNAFKYVFRCKSKINDKEDLQKAIWYENKYLELRDKLKKQY